MHCTAFKSTQSCSVNLSSSSSVIPWQFMSRCTRFSRAYSTMSITLPQWVSLSITGTFNFFPASFYSEGNFKYLLSRTSIWVWQIFREPGLGLTSWGNPFEAKYSNIWPQLPELMAANHILDFQPQIDFFVLWLVSSNSKCNRLESIT